LAKSKPDQILYATSGVGSLSHLSGELLNFLAGIKLVHVPYQGSAQAMADVLAGRVMAAFAPVNIVWPHVEGGKLKALATTENKRSAMAPDVPTMAEAAGLPRYDSAIWYGLLAPAGTPRDVIDKISGAVNEALKADDTLARCASRAWIRRAADLRPLRAISRPTPRSGPRSSTRSVSRNNHAGQLPPRLLSRGRRKVRVQARSPACVVSRAATRHHRHRTAREVIMLKLPTHNRYDYSSIEKRPDFDWPGGKRLAFYVALNVEQFAFLAGRGADPDASAGARRRSATTPGATMACASGSGGIFRMLDELRLPCDHPAEQPHLRDRSRHRRADQASRRRRMCARAQQRGSSRRAMGA
jgi:hypothetical protein